MASASPPVHRRRPDPSLPEPFELAFAPLHKGAFGVAVGVVGGGLVALVTAFHAITEQPSPEIGLLANYFYGYTVSWSGVAIGFGWGFFTGFVAGWFLAFLRNFTLAVHLVITQARADLSQSFLDHI